MGLFLADDPGARDMAKLILLSIILYMTILPVYFAGKSSPKRRLKTIQTWLIVAVIVWAIACREWYPALVPVEF
jgi:hypothetical protein